MGQILIRGIGDDVMALFKARAQRHGRSQEQEARLVIEAAALESDRAARLVEFAEGMRARFAKRGRDWGDSTRIIRQFRDSR